MRIALFTDTFPPQVNGVANTVYRYAEALNKMGHEIRVFTVSKYSSQELKEKLGDTFSVHTFPSLHALVYPGERVGIPFVGALKAIRTFNPDIIHTHTPFSVGWNATYAARKLQIPLVGTHHTFFDHYLKHIHLDFSWARNLSWKLTVRYYNYCDTITSPTRSLEQALIEHGLHRPVGRVPNVLDTELFAPPPHQKNTNTHTIVHMGRLSYEKSIHDVIAASAHIMKHLPNTRLVLIGDGPERGKLEALTRELSIANQTVFTGYVYGQNLVHALRQGDVFITGSKSENMPLAILEAMAVGLPIVAVRSLGLEEILMDGENAYLTDPDQPLELADAALTLLQNNTLREKFAAASRALSRAYSQDAVINRVIDLYTRTISEFAAKNRATFFPET